MWLGTDDRRDEVTTARDFPFFLSALTAVAGAFPRHYRAQRDMFTAWHADCNMVSGGFISQSCQQPEVSHETLRQFVKDRCNDGCLVLVTNVAIGAVAWPTFYLLGFDHPGLWALFAGVVHIVPYVGSIALATLSAVFHYVGAPDIVQSLTVGLVILVVASLVGTLLPTWLQSRTSRMNQVAIFVGVMFWGWMWGLWGLFLGAPIVVIAKVVCDNVSALRGTARLLGD